MTENINLFMFTKYVPCVSNENISATLHRDLHPLLAKIVRPAKKHNIQKTFFY